MTRTATTRRESLVRVLWIATTGEGLIVVGVFAALFLLQVWLAWHRHDHTLPALARGFRGPMFWLGWSLVFSSSLISRKRRGRWFTLLGPAPETAGPSLEDPGTIAVAQPILTGLGTACLGFAIGLNVIVSFSPDAQRSGSDAVSVLMYLGFVLLLGVALYSVTSSTRRLYLWSQEVAASAATAAADADRARITALQAQMNPHFLFNALNTVASLLGSDGKRARRTVQNLSGMLQHTLQRSAQPLTTVADELQFVRDYLDIERERFGSRLQVSYSIDPEVTARAVPTMSLQPLVENAIKHAITNRIEGGHIRIAASKRTLMPAVLLSVEDDGPGFAPGSEDGTGLGNLRARLRSLYGPPPVAELVTETLPTGARVSLTIPNPPNPSNQPNPSNPS